MTRKKRTKREQRESYKMAMKLLLARRISQDMALWALKETGHLREDAEKFLREYKEAEEKNVL